MTTPLSKRPQRDNVNTTEPDFWLDDANLLSDETDFLDAKTDPSQTNFDEVNGTITEVRYNIQLRSRERALTTFLQTMRRVFSGDGQA